MAHKSKLSIVRAYFEKEGLDKQQVDFLVKFYEMIRRRSDPTNHNIFCDEIGDKINMSKDTIWELANYFKKRPYRYINIDVDKKFASLRASTYLVELLKSTICVM